MNALLELKKQMEIDFLKTKTYEEINDMFNQMNDKLKAAEKNQKKLLIDYSKFVCSNLDVEIIDEINVNDYLKSIKNLNK